jgi:two-component system, chemotaxis family, protein-glutamate methylesterase/glutaminase
VLLSGAGDDGVAGLRAIKGRGGLAVVQNPADALYPDLAQHALDAVDVDRIAPVAEMGRVLAALAREPAPPTPAPGAALEKEARIAELDLDVVEDDDKVGRPSAYSCPDCGGVLWEIEHDDFLRFRCRVGHAFTSRALAEEQGDAVERALWAAFRTLEESEAFARRLAVRARRAGHQWLAERYLRRAEETSVDAAAIRRMIVEIGEQHETAVTAKAIADPYRPTEAGR